MTGVSGGLAAATDARVCRRVAAAWICESNFFVGKQNVHFAKMRDEFYLSRSSKTFLHIHSDDLVHQNIVHGDMGEHIKAKSNNAK